MAGAKDTRTFQKKLTVQAREALENGELMDDVCDLKWIHMQMLLVLPRRCSR